MQQVRQTRGKGEGVLLIVSDTWNKHTKLIARPSLIRMAFRRSWYHIEGRGRHTIPFIPTAFWYHIFVISFVIIIAILIFRLDVNLAKEDVALYGTLVSVMWRNCVWIMRTWLIIALVTL